jgi:two-component system cell cycle response regulator DivK
MNEHPISPSSPPEPETAAAPSSASGGAGTTAANAPTLVSSPLREATRTGDTGALNAAAGAAPAAAAARTGDTGSLSTPTETATATETATQEGAVVRLNRPSMEPSEAHVLVVEDNVPNFVLIARMLAFMGVQRCEWKTSGWQVVQFAETLPRVDLILMDIRLPYDDGYQALQKLRANARLKDTVVVAVTAEASEEQLRRARKAGFNGFLGKPLDPDRFPLQIRRLLHGEEVWEWK